MVPHKKYLSIVSHKKYLFIVSHNKYACKRAEKKKKVIYYLLNFWLISSQVIYDFLH